MGRLRSTALIIVLVSAVSTDYTSLAADVSSNDIDIGVYAAAARVSRESDGFSTATEAINSTKSFIESIFKSDGSKWSPRAVRLASEVIAVGYMARIINKENQLKPEEMKQFLSSFVSVVNSWDHDKF